jgi:predicted DNA-binding transcriptional regulator
MASLGKMAEMLKVSSPVPEYQTEQERNDAKKAVGQKRRAWLDSTENTQSIAKNNGVDKPLTKKGSIDPLHKPVSSTPFIKPFDQPLIDKGSIEGVYSPHSKTIENLRGNPLAIILFVFELLKNEPDKKTRKMTITDIVESLQISRDSARTATRFLLKNEFITRVDLKIGKHGWSQYSMPETLFNGITIAIKKGVIDPFKAKAIMNNDKGSNSSSSLNNTTTTKTDEKIVLGGISQEWANIDIQPLKEINFTIDHLKQIIAHQKLSPEIVQTSINAFAFDLKENAKAKKITQDPLSFFVGILRKGNPYIPPSNYESIEDKAMRLYYEKIKEIVKARSEREKEVVEYEFVAWSEKTPEQEKKKIAPSYPIGSTGFIATLKEFFCKDIWPKRKKELFENDQTTKLEVTSV